MSTYYAAQFGITLSIVETGVRTIEEIKNADNSSQNLKSSSDSKINEDLRQRKRKIVNPLE